MFDISKIFKEALSNAPIDDTFYLEKQTMSLADQRQFIISNFDNKGVLLLKNLVKKLNNKLEIILCGVLGTLHSQSLGGMNVL